MVITFLNGDISIFNYCELVSCMDAYVCTYE